jgi:hypothetical protein
MNFFSFSKFIKILYPKMAKIIVAVLIFGFAHTIYIVSANAEVVREQLPDNKVFNDFVVGPGKIEMELSAGQTGTFDLMVSNRLGTKKDFGLTFEDFTGSEDPNQTVVLLGSDRGPYSLYDFIKISTTTVAVDHGTRVRVPVSVSIPKNAEPGGLYGSVIVGTMSKADELANSSGVVSTNPIFTRIGVLIFVRVKGEAKEDGKLVDFALAQNKKIISGTDGVTFNLFFKNDGNVHLNPKGTVVIKNMLGSTVGSVNVEPWFAMPKSLRFREVSWNPAFLFGKYTATASIERGYGTVKDEINYSFWAIPWKAFIVVLAGIIVLVVIVKKFRTKSNIIATFALLFIFQIAQGATMSSSNYKVEIDSVNFGGARSLSGSYTIEDSAGEVGTGYASSTSFALHAGYQQNSTSNLYITPASNVTMTPSIPGLTGGTSNGQTSLTVTTDNSAGYETKISAEDSPALNTAYASFADYVPAGANPDYTFTNLATNSTFAFSPEGTDIASRYKNSGASCGVGASDDANACWDGLSTSDKTIAIRNSSNMPAGTVTTLKFRAQSGSSHVQPDGVYTATTTITVIAL